ncbi:hypothetical protein RDV89_09430 [Nocardioides zeae]|uniref:Peptide chain release factor 2 n=1 Tax=Nocardioides imazamoxiresistens TaxID=3231893 RepID=A0ABU3PVL4_9ACTN|nr:hypothetical protein [Nocardioides zeae]MDT9593287.1 hypothetical protein [Nocardioides zeae]
MGERLLEPPQVPGQARRTIVAGPHGVLFDDTLPGDGRFPEVAEVAPLPDLAAWVSAAESRVPFAIALCDREGGDVSFLDAVDHRGAEVTTHGGRTLHEHQVGVEVAEPEYQRHSEQTWRRNAQDVAAALREGVRTRSLDLVLLAGDERARHLVADELTGLAVEVVHLASGSRAPGASADALWTEVEVAVAAHQAGREAAVLERLGAGEGQAGTAARGLDDVLDAFVRGQVEQLLVDLEAASELRVDPTAYPGLPVPAGLGDEAPADRVLIAVAAATQADVVVVPAAQTGGTPVNAVLRWADGPQPPQSR